MSVIGTHRFWYTTDGSNPGDSGNTARILIPSGGKDFGLITKGTNIGGSTQGLTFAYEFIPGTGGEDYEFSGTELGYGTQETSYYIEGGTIKPNITVNRTYGDVGCSGPVNATSGGQYWFYVQGWINQISLSRIFIGRTVKIMFTVDGGSPLAISPSSGTIVDNVTGVGPVVTQPFGSTIFTIQNGTGPYSITYTGLPSTMGLSSSSTGSPVATLVTSSSSFYVVGTPDTAATYSSIQFTVTDQSTAPNPTYPTVSASPYTLNITTGGSGGGLTVAQTAQSPTYLKQSLTTSIEFTASGGTGTYTFSIDPGHTQLPPGLSISTASNKGYITGIPIEGADTLWSGIRVVATDTGSGPDSGYKDIDLNVQSACWIDGLYADSPQVETIFPDATLGTGYSTTTLTARGGKVGGTKTIYFQSTDLTGGSPSAGTGLTDLNFTVATATSGGWTYNTGGSTLGVSGAPSAGASRIFQYKVQVETTGGGTVSTTTSESASYYKDTVNVTGGGGLIISTPVLTGAAPYQGSSDAFYWSVASSIAGSGNFHWSIDGTDSAAFYIYPPNPSYTTGLKWLGNSYPAKYGAQSINIHVSRDSGETGVLVFNYYINPHIFSGVFSPYTFTRGQPITPVVVTYNGGGNGTFSYSNTAPSWMTVVPQGTGNNQLRFTGTPNESPGTGKTFTVTATESVSAWSQTFTYSYDVSGGSVTLTPYSANLCPRVPTDPDGRKASAIVGATCSGTPGTYTISASGGTFSSAGPYLNGQEIIWTAPNSTLTAYTLTYTSVADGSVTATQTITVTAGGVSIGNTTVAPASVVKMWHSQTQGFTITLPFSSCATPANAGRWNFIPSHVFGCTNSPHLGNSTTVSSPSSITTAQAAQMTYEAYENPDDNIQYIGIILLPNEQSNFSITSPTALPAATSGSPYSYTFTTQNATGTVYFALLPGFSEPAGLTLQPNGVLSGTPSQTVTDWVLPVVAHDSSSPAKWDGNKFTITVNPSGGTIPSVSSIAPPTGADAGGTPIIVYGQNLASGDLVIFAYPYAGISGACSGYTYGSVPNSISCYTSPAIVAGSTIAAGISRSGYTGGWKNSAFTYGGSTLSITGINPSTVIVNPAGSPLTVTLTGNGYTGSTTVDYDPNTSGHTGYIGGLTITGRTSSTLTVTLPATYFSDATYVGSPLFKVTDGGSTAVSAPGLFRVLSTALDITTIQTSFHDGYRTSGYLPIVYAQAVGGTPGSSGYIWTLVSGTYLPDGLYLFNGTSGYGGVSGTPTAGALTKTFTLRVTDSVAGIKEKPFTIQIVGGTPTITTTSVPNATIGVPYSTTLLVSGGVSPFTWSIVSGAIPNGLTLDPSTGVISGTPVTQTAPSNWNFTVKVTDNATATNTKSLSMALNATGSPITITGISPVFGPLSGGTLVTLTGTGFKSGCSVKFGTVAATATSFIDATTVRAVAPAKATAGLVTIAVTNTDGGYGEFSSYEYRDIQTPIITGLDKRDGPFAGNQAVRLYGENFAGITWVRFNTATDSNADAVIVNNNTGVIPNELDITTPQGYQFSSDGGATALTVNIYANNAQGVGSVADLENWYTYRPPPIITAIVPNSGPTSGGQALYVLGRNFFQRGDTLKPRVFIGNVEVDPANIRLVEE